MTRDSGLLFWGHPVYSARAVTSVILGQYTRSSYFLDVEVRDECVL